jgi:hypothetical protein
MNEEPCASSFSVAWIAFEDRLVRFLTLLENPEIDGRVSIDVPFTDELLPHTSRVRRDAVAIARLADGFTIRIDGERARFHRFEDAPRSFPVIARELCARLRTEWHIAHPSLLTVRAEPDVAAAAAVLGLAESDRVVREATNAPLALRVDGHVDARDVVGQTLTIRFGEVSIDDDEDLRVEVDGVGFYVSLPEGQPLLRMWTPVVRNVGSRRAATIEANYLNRLHPLTKWVLWGRALTQEIHMPLRPFIPCLFNELLDRFAEQYIANVSSLQLRLGGE